MRTSWKKITEIAMPLTALVVWIGLSHFILDKYAMPLVRLANP